LIFLIVLFGLSGFYLNIVEHATALIEEGIYGTLGQTAANAPLNPNTTSGWVPYAEYALIVLGMLLIIALIIDIAMALKGESED